MVNISRSSIEPRFLWMSLSVTPLLEEDVQRVRVFLFVAWLHYNCREEPRADGWAKDL